MTSNRSGATSGVTSGSVPIEMVEIVEIVEWVAQQLFRTLRRP